MASGVGGGPVPVAGVTGVPGSRAGYVTSHAAMVCPAGGAIVALMATGLVTIEPSAGVGGEMVGGGGAGFHVKGVTFETSGNPLIWANAWTWSVPALPPRWLKLARPVESVVP